MSSLFQNSIFFSKLRLWLVCTHIINLSASTCTQLSYIHKRNNLIFMTMSNYGSWSLPQLKDELRKRKARISGRKHELIER